MTDESLEFRYGFLRQAAEGYDNFSDGAWFAAIEDAVRMHNEEHSLQLDPNQRVLYFLKNGSNG
jgi:hypothetical protein